MSGGRSLIRELGEFNELVTVRGRWVRDNPRTDRDRFRHYVRVGRFRVRVPWLVWAMFS